MPAYDYLIVGGGMTTASAITGIREVDDTGTIGVIGAEPHPPYNRPPLSKGLWLGKPVRSIWRKANAASATFHHSRTATTLDRAARTVTDDRGDVYHYENLLLATGSRARRLPFGEDQVLYYRTLDDYERLRRLADTGRHLAVVGGGFVGSELAASLNTMGKRVTLVFPGEAIGSRLYPPALARTVSALYESRGVELAAGARAVACESRGAQQALTVRDVATGRDRTLLVDGVVVGVGAEPNVELAQSAGLAVQDGIRVDASLRTSDPHIFAAGDVASVYNPALKAWRRVEHADSANHMGGYAGVAMTGRTLAYEYLPFFYSDFYNVSYEAVGEVDSRLEMVEEWTTPYGEGSVWYLRDGRVRGALFWNIFGQLGAGRRAIAAGGFTPAG
ncbi:MAG TPA: FAD-dependent oxidoreductase [Gemmatimonadaceae bacterium]|jgi:NADPH-dependent 2,4-dienoyl-CoA reductase/sulfur reductase-like enzyme|nr:FAD-dependent oxidoreductase [Gemmatimonadaceae bacterium]